MASTPPRPSRDRGLSPLVRGGTAASASLVRSGTATSAPPCSRQNATFTPPRPRRDRGLCFPRLQRDRDLRASLFASERGLYASSSPAGRGLYASSSPLGCGLRPLRLLVHSLTLGAQAILPILPALSSRACSSASITHHEEEQLPAAAPTNLHPGRHGE